MRSLDVNDTIAAIASAPGPAERGVVRISGPDTARCLEQYFRADHGSKLSECQNATRVTGTFKLDSDTEIAVSLYWWPDERSFTRQPCGELHLVGSVPILDLVLKRLFDSGARCAEPGEFTMRAFLSGRIDLTQAEAVLAVIDSTSKHQFKSALRQLSGGLGGPITDVRNDLLELLAELEAGLDFVEEDIEFISAQEIHSRLSKSQQIVEATLTQMSERSIRDSFIDVVLIGKPNAGKSSLFNALSTGAAIVSDVAGTTRDYVSAELKIDNRYIRLTDTAGIEAEPIDPLEVLDEIDAQANRFALEQNRDADIRLLCVAPNQTLPDWQQQSSLKPNTLVVFTKSDIGSADCKDFEGEFNGQVVRTSATMQSGLEELKNAICNLAGNLQNTNTEGIALANARASESLAFAKDTIAQAVEASQTGAGEEVVAAEIRSVLEHLGAVVGTIYTDDILDLVFSRFCIGK